MWSTIFDKITKIKINLPITIHSLRRCRLTPLRAFCLGPPRNPAISVIASSHRLARSGFISRAAWSSVLLSGSSAQEAGILRRGSAIKHSTPSWVSVRKEGDTRARGRGSYWFRWAIRWGWSRSWNPCRRLRNYFAICLGLFLLSKLASHQCPFSRSNKWYLHARIDVSIETFPKFLMVLVDVGIQLVVAQLVPFLVLTVFGQILLNCIVG